MASAPDVDRPVFGYFVTSEFQEVILYCQNVISHFDCSCILHLHCSALFERENTVQEMHLPINRPIILDPQLPEDIYLDVMQNQFGLCHELDLYENMDGSGWSLVPGTHRYWFKIFPCQPNHGAHETADNHASFDEDEDDQSPRPRSPLPKISSFFMALTEHFARKNTRYIPRKTDLKYSFFKEYLEDNPSVGITPDELDVEFTLQDVPEWHNDVNKYNIRVFSMRGNILYAVEKDPEVEYIDLYLNSKNKFALVRNLHTLYKRKKDRHICEQCLAWVGPKHTCEQQKLVSPNEDVQVPEVPEGRHAFVAYADFESIITPSKQHKTSGWAYVIIDKMHTIKKQEHKNALHSRDLISDFMKSITQAACEYAKDDGHHTKECPLCEQIVTTDYVIGRNFINGRQGSHHEECWNNSKNTMVIFFHNFRGYDSHFLMSEIVSTCNVLGLQATSMEKFNLIRINPPNEPLIQISFKDTFNFFTCSLAKCVSMIENWVYTPESNRTQKGVFPYEWFDSYEKLKATELPSPPWYNSLSGQLMDHEIAFKEWSEHGFTTFEQYHDFYMVNDVMFLCDAFEEFRRTCVDEFNTDPAHFQGAPGFTWYLGLCQNPALFKIIQSEEIYMDIQNQIRGGISQAMVRYCNVEDKPEESMFFLDVNSLYSSCMVEKLPGKYLHRLLELPPTWKELYCSDGPITALINCDLIYPEHLHDRDWAYPLAPHKFNDRLCTTFKDRENYLVHAKLLQFYLERGLILEKVNYIYVFEQDYCLRDYVQGNIEKRRHTKSEVMKTLYKLLNNSIYGKTCENVNKYRSFKVFHDETILTDNIYGHSDQINTQLIKARNMQLYGENFLLEMRVDQVRLNKPIQIGFAILEFAKLKIYQFLAAIQDVFGKSVIPLYTDTDSLLFWCDFPRPWEKFYNSPLLPFLDFEKAFKLGKDTDKQSGLWSPEAGGKEIVEYVGLRAKCYSYRFRDNETVVKNKGVPKAAMISNEDETPREKITMEHYRDALFNGTQHHVVQYSIRSNKHDVTTVKQYKLGLSANDLKRAILPDRTHSLPFGYKGTLFTPTDNDTDL
uniref:DNA-directed DNA polymerase n=1 Tax=Tarsiger cyanurus densovirus TaxID=2794546 RepID=A0A8A4XDP1_9VIRU|nr:MAG: PolB [Tarsiger cyanurus densovirus]